MRSLKVIFDFYINCSIHVAFSCYSLVCITQLLFFIPTNDELNYFAFFGTIVGYNFVKYDELARIKKLQMRNQLRLIIFLSFCSFIMAGYYFFQLERISQIIAFVFLALTLLYTLPFFPNKKNARNWAGVKIYIVSLSWVGVTVVLPVLNAYIALEINFFIVALQRFLLIFVILLIFEIIDLKNDSPHLQTVPQQIGVRRTKKLGFLLMLLLCVLEILNINLNTQYFLLPTVFKIGIATVVVLFLTFANEQRSKYYTSFWVESIPIIWWLLLIFF